MEDNEEEEVRGEQEEEELKVFGVGGWVGGGNGGGGFLLVILEPLETWREQAGGLGLDSRTTTPQLPRPRSAPAPNTANSGSRPGSVLQHHIPT